MKTTISEATRRAIVARVEGANAQFYADYPGESGGRQPCQTAYVNPNEFHPDLARAWGDEARRALKRYAPDAATLAQIVAPGGAPHVAETVYARVVEKLSREPVEDLRIDFEDGYGPHSDADEDADAVRVAIGIADADRRGALPPFFGIRVKPLNAEFAARSVRTVDGFLTALVHAAGGRLPNGFRFTLAKVTTPEQVSAFRELLDALEQTLNLAPASLTFEIMIEVAQALIGPRGEVRVAALVAAGGARCTAAHLGAYDFTSSCGIVAAHQSLAHPACDIARQLMLVSLAGRAVFLSDGSTHRLPAPDIGADGVLEAWRIHASDVRRSLVQGFYQGWDMHPVQLPTRYAAVYTFFLEALPRATERMTAFLGRIQSAPVGEALEGGHSSAARIVDDAATGQALLNFFLRGVTCGAITEDEAIRSGLTPNELHTRAFDKTRGPRLRTIDEPVSVST